MFFYIIMGGLFTLYGSDLLAHVIISVIARAREIQAAVAVKRERKREAKHRAAISTNKEPKPGKFAFGNESMVAIHKGEVKANPMPAIKTGTGDKEAGSKAASDEEEAVAAAPASPASTPQAPPCPEPHQRLREERSPYPTALTPSTPRHDELVANPYASAPSSPYCQDDRDNTTGSTSRTNPLLSRSSTDGDLTGTTTSSLRQHRSRMICKSVDHSRNSSVGSPVSGPSSSEITGNEASEAADVVVPSSEGQAAATTAKDVTSSTPSAPPTPTEGSSSPDLKASAVPTSDPATPGRLAVAVALTRGAGTDAAPVVIPLTPAAQALELTPGTAAAAKPYGWGFGSGMFSGSKPSVSLPSSGGSLVSVPSSCISTDIIIKAELVTMKQQVKGKKPMFSFKEGMECLEHDTELAWPLPIEDYPLVLIQVPMYNEEAHAALIVERCCAIAWPRTRVLIQVLDDSTKAHIREKVDAAAVACMEAGHPVQVLRRTNRQGFKAGAMVAGLEHVAPMGFKYCAIFDADFEPPRDFLLETIGPLEGDDHLGFVQTRWHNPHKSFLTWAQKVNLGFHFDVEQRCRSFMGWFFNFNGTAGVWRIQAIEEAGGWETDTVVEDMDLSLRAYLAGWRGLYLPHVGCVNEVPDDLSTYKTQQYRWLCGPMQILTKAFLTIWRAKNVPLRLRLNCYWFFARYVLFAVITLAVLLVPPIALWIDRWHWRWPEIFFCASINFALVVFLYITPWSIAYMLFSVATGYFKAWAMLGGLLGSQKSKSWKVTTKKGAQADAGPITFWEQVKGAVGKIGTPYALEMGLFIYYSALAGLAFGAVGMSEPSWIMGGYTTIMAIIFFFISFGDAFL